MKKILLSGHGILLATCIMFCIVFVKNFSVTGGQQFTVLAQSFLAGRLDLLSNDTALGALDTVYRDGKYYWHLGPFPAILLVPFVMVSQHVSIFFYQGYLQFFISIGVFYLAYKLSILFGYTKTDSMYLAFAFVFASIYSFISLYSHSWYFSQAVVTILLFASLYMHYTKKSYLAIGICTACILATRLSVIPIIGYFIAHIFLIDRATLKEKMIHMVSLLTPIVVVIMLLLLYNYARFGSILETGYNINSVSPETVISARNTRGLLQVQNVPTNIYWYFIAPPNPVFEGDSFHLIAPFFQANPWGMSFFIMSPLFIWIFLRGLTQLNIDKIVLWSTSFLMLANQLLWFSTGYFQVGPRYMLDFLPLWFILLLYSFTTRKLQPRHKAIILISSCVNAFLVLTAPK